MPKYRKPNEEEVALLSQVQGVDATSYIVDDESGQAIPADKLPGNVFTAGAAGVGRGTRNLVAGAIEFPGRIADAIREGPRPGSEDRRPGPPMPAFLERFVDKRTVQENPDWKPLAAEDRSIFTRAGEGIREIGQEGLLAPDPAAAVSGKRAVAEKVGEAIGSILPLVLPQLAAMRAGAAPEAIGALNAGSIAGATSAASNDVVDRALAQQKAEGKEPSLGEAVDRGLEYAPAAYLENKLLGALGPLSETGIPRRLAELITKEGAVKGLKFGGREFLHGAVGEGVDTATQQALAGAPLDAGEIGESALYGGAGQGAVATGAAMTSGKTKAPAPAGPTAEELAAGGQAEQAKAAEAAAQTDKARQLRNAARLDSQRRGTPYQPLNPSPVDEVFADIQKKKIPVDEEILNKLEDTYANNPANVPKLQEVARVLTDELMLSRPDKLVPETERVAKVQEELSKIDSQLDAVQKRVDSITDGIEKRAEKMSKSPPSKAAGAEWLAFARERAETEQGELKILADQMRALLDQRKLLTQNAAPTVEGGPQPIGEPVQNKVLTAEQADAQKAGRLLTASEAQTQNLEALRQQGETQSQAEAAKLAGAEDPVTKSLQGYAEGEQGLPFSGEGNETATYGTLIPPSLLEETKAKAKDYETSILRWLMFGGDEPKAPTVLYRGNPQGTADRDSAQIAYHHYTPWLRTAEKGGSFGGAFDVYETPAHEDQKYYRGGALAGDPLESTRINSIKGMTFQKALTITKQLYERELQQRLAYEGEYLASLSPEKAAKHLTGIKKSAAETAFGDLRNGTFETDALNRDGVWVSVRDIPKRLQRRQPGLRTRDEITEYKVYASLIPPSLVESVTKAAKDNGLKLLDPVRMVHAVTQAESDRMVQKGPVGTHVVSKFDPLYIDREKITNRKRGEWKELYEKHKAVLDTPEFQKWRNEAHTKQQRDLTKLPPHMHEAANALDAYIKSFHAEQKAEGIKTIERRNDGRHIYRDPIDVEGYGVFDIDNDVYRAMEEGGDKWAKYRQDWLDHWVQQKGSLDGAEEALNSFRGSFAKTRLTGGEPLFSAIRNQIGTSLPESWRSKNIHDSMLNYIDNWAMDVSWARNVQKDPIMRRAFGITRDPAGNDTTVADANYKPTKEQWEQILTRARKADAGWLKTFKPGDAMDMPILADSEFGRKFRANYTQTPLSQSAGGQIAEAANQVASSVMMMHTSKLRNIMQSGITVLDYAMSPDIVPVMSALIDTIVDPKAAIARTEKAGAMSMDVMRQEAASAVQTGLYKGLRTFREWTGLNAMDKYAKAIAYNVARAAIEHQAKTQGRNAPLLREFGQIDAPASTPMSELIDQAAAVVANHVDPQYDIRSVPATMIPQDRGFVGNMMRLMTWSVARFNHWYNDAYIPAVTGGDKTRLFKSIFVGAIGAVATQELLAWLQGKMPRDLSFGEWLKLDSKKQQDEFAPMLFGYLQAQGNMGVLGDIAYATARKATGKSVNQDYSRPMIPAFLVGSDLYNTVTDFGSYVMQERGGVENTDITDWMMLGVELAKTAQTLRAVVSRGDSWLPERLQDEAKLGEDKRERRVFEETTGRSALTGEKRDPMSLEGQAAAVVPNKFSLQKEFNMRSGADFEKLGPSLARRALQGWSPKTDAALMDDMYYDDIAKRRGGSVAARLRARNEQKESDRPYKRQVARELGQTAAAARAD